MRIVRFDNERVTSESSEARTGFSRRLSGGREGGKEAKVSSRSRLLCGLQKGILG